MALPGSSKHRQRALTFTLLMSGGLIVFELIGAFASNSLSLLSDAGHVFIDFLAVGLALVALRLSAMPITSKRTFGLFRAEVLAALLNGVLLFLISIFVFYEATRRLIEPQVVNAPIAMVFGVVGLIINIVAVVILQRENREEENINVRAAFWHVLSDTLSSVGVLGSALVIYFTGWTPIDSVVSLMIAMVIIRGAISLINESVMILMETTPKDINVDHLKHDIRQIPQIIKVHDVHVWTVTSGRYNLSAHILAEPMTVADSEKLYERIDKLLREEYKIEHSTIQFEATTCFGKECELPSRAPKGLAAKEEHSH